jgi:PAS domain S-box-containing protein
METGPSEPGGVQPPAGDSGERAPETIRRHASPLLDRYAPILDSMLDGVLMADGSGMVVAANDAAVRILGASREDLLVPLQAYPERFAMRPPDGSPALPVGSRALAGEVVEPVERVIRTPEGTEKHLRTSAAPLRRENGRIIGAVILLADVTAERSAEARAREYADELRKAYDESQSAIRQRDEVLSVVSHDLRSPLGAVMMATSTIVRMASDERLRKAAGHAYRAAQHMRRLIDDLVTVARARGGRLALELGEVSPAELTSELVEMFEQLAQHKGVTLRGEPVSIARPITCDGVRIVEALSNYLTNALEITPAGGVISVGAEERPREIVFWVRDTGPGIASADLARIFDQHYRAPGITYQGTGLGLAIAKAIAEAHGGRVWAESEAGEGSAFFLALPAPAA